MAVYHPGGSARSISSSRSSESRCATEGLAVTLRVFAPTLTLIAPSLTLSALTLRALALALGFALALTLTHPNPDPKPGQVRREGWLSKRGEGGAAKFTKRWCVLDSSYRMHFYKDKAQAAHAVAKGYGHGRAEQGSIDLAAAYAASDVRQVSPHPNPHPDPTPTRTLTQPPKANQPEPEPEP